MTATLRAWLRPASAVLVRPHLWVAGLRQSHRSSRPGWWRRPPFLPVPDAAYLAFRAETQYGTHQAPEPDHVVAYLEWCRDTDRARTHSSTELMG